MVLTSEKMSIGKPDLICSPSFLNKLIYVGADLRLYKVEETISNEYTRPKVELLCVNGDYQYLRCASVCPREEYAGHIAVGQSNGKVVITSFDQAEDTSSYIGCEFIPRHTRQCVALAWNPLEVNLVASCLEKHRGDSGLIVWDLNKPSISQPTNDPDRKSVSSAYDYNSNIGKTNDYGMSETANSVQWFPSQSKTFVAGFSFKHLRILDLREPTRQQTGTPTKAVYGLSFDPFNSNRLASFFESIVVLWDVRYFEKPVITIPDSRTISKIAWCPTRGNLLASVGRDSSGVRLFDIQQTGSGADEQEPAILQRSVLDGSRHNLASFCWHSVQRNRLIAINTANEIFDQVVLERITLNWSASSKLTWSKENRTLHYIDQHDPSCNIDDISVKMRRRVLERYGMNTVSLRKNVDIVKDDLQLVNLWLWLTLVKVLRNNPEFQSSGKQGLIGNASIYNLFRGENAGGTSSRSEGTYKSFAREGPGGPITTGLIRSYCSPDRDRALQLCDWGCNPEQVSATCDRLTRESSYERAAAIALFNMKMEKCLQILEEGTRFFKGDPPLSVVAMAISGFTDDRLALWRETCDALRPQLNGPYLRAMFAFLTCDDDSYDDILNEEGLYLSDRVAFACSFLSDSKLADYLDKLLPKLIESGCLDGLLLTGFSHQGIELLQRYVDITGDIQTVSLLAINALPFETSSDQRIQQWIETYRELLDQWQLWHQRAELDIMWHRKDPSWRPLQQIFINCNFCGKSISPQMHPLGRAQFAKIQGTPNKSKLTTCIGCRKALPRCALCLIHMGTGSVGLLGGRDDNIDESRHPQMNPFPAWFTWCQSCRHGGHSDHIIDWFKDHAECPVTGCVCKCLQQDEL